MYLTSSSSAGAGHLALPTTKTLGSGLLHIIRVVPEPPKDAKLFECWSPLYNLCTSAGILCPLLVSSNSSYSISDVSITVICIVWGAMARKVLHIFGIDAV